ncbi:MULTISPECIES: DNA circularization N-terminal domain-containing protein [unclassified Vibrio]|uniref:DNA circularization N-terminal domain-containing protein n=1 Tax=unclassified Vibrio TaxID=2614977 RepID=UPI001361C39F|nr:MULTISPECIES: DNA circularization N-terminal domain-containing protein [unclassified Vibrio]NAW58749.1 hypothetical protein [Vibrio sp. V36_P2S2PM302]NAX27182.1 hypothetical protein [Vibrio sp. V38_P2S17PM301]NAX32186.1 hypothetical protein [Vibrio sp. V37_P2S8PM304]
MWERQYEHGRWNGHTLNILSTAIDGGQRLHISDIPYADLPHIKVMGSKARSLNVEAVFVGPASLAEANALIESLETSPEGELEHPWLGELPLVFDTFSQSISTKRGLVTLSLSFVRSGITPTITTPALVHAKEQATIVENLSGQAFSQDVKNMDVSLINQTQQRFSEAIHVLVDITNRLNLADDTLQTINHAINEAFSMVSSLSHAPDKFAARFTAAVDAVARGVQSEPTSASEAVDNARTAQALLLKQVKPDTTTAYYNVQMVTGAIKVSKDLNTLEKDAAFDVTDSNKQPAIIQSDLAALVSGVDDRIEEVTQVSTKESLALFDALVVLKAHVQKQHDKVSKGRRPHRLVATPKYRPALALAHDEYTRENIITAINALQHPLFLRGDIAVRDV